MGIKPQFFLVRPGAEQITPNGQVLSQPATAVPLIPADLLPEWIEVIGAPRKGLGEVGLTGFPDWWLQARGLMPMPPQALRAADAPNGRRTARKIGNLLRRKQRARILAQRRDVHFRNLEEGSEAEDEYEDEEDVGEEVVKPEPKRGGEEGILIDLD
ncbi:hypothetical protein FOC4_g10014878 [Fusarium odoratissimum]|uniref:Uncharacterized protein n=1 Tax=Fusarium oxysporum f. sp. cubense (strain race 4) TaxID=2502994 RepID=N1R7B8_FUSC4|nr:hypothetical protein FOC4_g10014878 [Fusarium odoratissimum]